MVVGDYLKCLLVVQPHERITEALTSVKSISRTDAATLLGIHSLIHLSYLLEPIISLHCFFWESSLLSFLDPRSKTWLTLCKPSDKNLQPTAAVQLLNWNCIQVCYTGTQFSSFF